jgi:hypothetical protein
VGETGLNLLGRLRVRLHLFSRSGATRCALGTELEHITAKGDCQHFIHCLHRMKAH